jgi:hypothetical protein
MISSIFPSPFLPVQDYFGDPLGFFREGLEDRVNPPNQIVSQPDSSFSALR